MGATHLSNADIAAGGEHAEAEDSVGGLGLSVVVADAVLSEAAVLDGGCWDRALARGKMGNRSRAERRTPLRGDGGEIVATEHLAVGEVELVVAVLILPLDDVEEAGDERPGRLGEADDLRAS